MICATDYLDNSPDYPIKLLLYFCPLWSRIHAAPATLNLFRPNARGQVQSFNGEGETEMQKRVIAVCAKQAEQLLKRFAETNECTLEPTCKVDVLSNEN